MFLTMQFMLQGQFAGTDGAKRAPGGTVTQESHTVSNRAEAGCQRGRTPQAAVPQKGGVTQWTGSLQHFFQS